MESCHGDLNCFYNLRNIFLRGLNENFAESFIATVLLARIQRSKIFSETSPQGVVCVADRDYDMTCGFEIAANFGKLRRYGAISEARPRSTTSPDHRSYLFKRLIKNMMCIHEFNLRQEQWGCECLHNQHDYLRDPANGARVTKTWLVLAPTKPMSDSTYAEEFAALHTL